jgi:hypothetical protein
VSTFVLPCAAGEVARSDGGGGRAGAQLKMKRPCSASTRKRLWTGFATHCVLAKPCFNCQVPAPSRQDTLRLRVLTRLNWRPSVWEIGRGLIGAVNGFKRSAAEWPLTAPIRHSHNRGALCVQQGLHQSASKTLSFFLPCAAGEVARRVGGGGRAGAQLKVKRPQSASPRKWLWNDFGAHSGQPKPSINCQMPAPSRQDTLRLRVLTRLNWRPFASCQIFAAG